MFKNPFSFEGRIRRLEYGLSYIIYMIACVLAGFFGELFDVSQSGLATVIFLLLFITLVWFMLAQGAKRCHDRGNSGIWQIIPFYGFWMLFADGEIGDNEYGPNPKGMYFENYNDSTQD